MSLLIKTIIKIIPGALTVRLVVSWLAWWPADSSNSFSAASCSLPHELGKLIRFGLNTSGHSDSLVGPWVSCLWVGERHVAL